MRKYQTTEEVKRVKLLITVKCDICQNSFDVASDRMDDEFEIQEFHCINRCGGYGSAFGDGDEWECDICQHCLKKLIGEHIRYINGTN